MVMASTTRARRAGVERSNHWSRLQRASMVLPPYRCDMHAHRMVALCRRQPFLAYWFQLLDWVCQGKNVAGIQAWGVLQTWISIELVASFDNRSHLLKSWEKTHTLRDHDSRSAWPKKPRDHAHSHSRSARELPAFF